MKRLFLIAGLMTAFGLFVFAASAVAPTNFAGNWALDKTKSTGLSARIQNADSVTWTITQDDKQISIETKVTGGQAPAGGGAGGGGGQGRGPAAPQIYTLDGKEVTTEAMGGTATMKATWSSDGKTLELSSVRAGSFNGNDFKATAVDKLSLSGDGKVLTVNRHTEGTRGNADSMMVLNKQ